MLDLTKWIAGRYLGGWGQVLDSVIPAGVKNIFWISMFSFCLLIER